MFKCLFFIIKTKGYSGICEEASWTIEQ